MPKQKIDRDDLLRYALNVFMKKGYYHTTVADIAEACGLLKGSIYHYIESKEALMTEVLEHLKQHYAKNVFAWAYDEDYEPEDRLQMLASKAEEIFLDRHYGNFFVNVGMETRNSIESFHKPILGFFEEWIQALTYLYSFVTDEKDARLTAEMVVAEVEGAAVLSQLLEDPEYLKRTNRKIVDIYTRWKKRPSGKGKPN